MEENLRPGRPTYKGDKGGSPFRDDVDGPMFRDEEDGPHYLIPGEPELFKYSGPGGAEINWPEPEVTPVRPKALIPVFPGP